MVRFNGVSKLWRRWLRHQRPAGRLLRWTAIQSSLVLLLCLFVAGASSLPWLLKPDLQPGALAPFNAIAPKDALVQDSTALEQRRSTLVARSVVQVLDPDQTQALKLRLERQLSELQQVSESGSAARSVPSISMQTNRSGWSNAAIKTVSPGTTLSGRPQIACSVRGW